VSDKNERELDFRQLSKTVSHALRHAPWLYELELDEEGWTSAEALLEGLRHHRDGWRDLTAADLQWLVDTSDKQRYEMDDGRIRARYGHSIQMRIRQAAAMPPELLYHGTAPATAAIILRDGLRPMRRQYVHLSADVATARQVGRRKAAQPILLTILAATAHQNGVTFYRGNDLVWLADFVPPDFIMAGGSG
jgi:putative RNA 2'-phosphotransferase